MTTISNIISTDDIPFITQNVIPTDDIHNINQHLIEDNMPNLIDDNI